MFLNCTAHSLTQEQSHRANHYSNYLLDLKDDNPVLYENLTNCPPDIERIKELVEELIEYLRIKWIESERMLIVHFPIGSPVFNAILFSKLDRMELPFRILFSHSDRVSIDKKLEDGTIIKKTVFKFIKFLEI